MILTFLSAVFGGLLRLAPELLKFLGQNQQNAHEINMQACQLEFLKVQGQQKTDEITVQGNIDISKSQVDAIVALNQSQAQMAIAGGWFTAALNALVRPLVTFYLFALWGLHTGVTMLYAYRADGDALGALMGTWTADDAAMLSMIASFWFVGRTLDKKG